MTKKKEDPAGRRKTRKESMQMKAAGAWDIVYDAVNNFSLNGDANQAAAIALYAILSAIPLFILTLIAAGSFFSSNATLQADIIGAVQGVHPYFSEALLQQLGKIEGKSQVLGWIGLLGLVWLSAAIFNAIESALNIIFRSRRKRNYFVSKLMAVAMIPAAWLIGGLSVLITYLAALLAEEPSGWAGGILFSLTMPAQIALRYLIPFLMVILLVTFVYRIIPTAKIRFSVVLAGSAIFSFLVEIAKQLFTWYLANYTRYNVIFGSLETVVILVIWVFYVALIFLFCAEIMSSFERRDMLLLERALLRPRHSLLKVDARLFQKFGRVYARDEVVFRENDSGCEMFYVLSGRIRMERSDGHVTKTLAEMGPGQYFGEMAALIDVRRTATARALEDSHLAVIDDRTFQDLMGESREAALAMLREFAARLKNSNAALEEFTRFRTQIIILMQILEHPEAAVDEHIRQISRLTRKEPDQVGEIMRDLAGRGILTGEGDQAPRINRDKMWSMLDSGT